MEVKKVELKAIKVLESMSEETFCYSANVYVNGKKAVEVSNNGHGGCDSQRALIADVIESLDLYFKQHEPASAYFNDNGEVRVSFSDLESWCSTQIVDYLLTKDLKKGFKNKLMFLVDGVLKEASFKSGGKKIPRYVAVNFFKQKYGKDLQILNLMPFEEAFHIYKEIDSKSCKIEGYVDFTPIFNEGGECINTPESAGILKAS